MSKRARTVSLADGRVVRLTGGEISALKRFIAFNGEEGVGPEGYQYDPGRVAYTTVRSLIAKGIFEMTEAGIPRFAKGVLSK